MEIQGKLFEARYRVDTKLHEGAMSSTFLGTDIKNGKNVIIKCAADDEDNIAKSSLLNEIRILSELNYRGIPEILDVYFQEKMVIVIMKYMEGVTINQLLSGKKRMDERMISKTLLQLCDILSYLHGQDAPVIHRDIKPENIIAGRYISLIDFGAARRYTRNGRKDTVCLGTVGFAAPEQFGYMGQSDVRTDIYALGKTLKRMLEASGIKNRKLKKIAEKCVRKEPELRYQCVEEVLAAFYGISGRFTGISKTVNITMIHTSERIPTESKKI
jgi:serine/threonine-protein kinase